MTKIYQVLRLSVPKFCASITNLCTLTGEVGRLVTSRQQSFKLMLSVRLNSIHKLLMSISYGTDLTAGRGLSVRKLDNLLLPSHE